MSDHAPPLSLDDLRRAYFEEGASVAEVVLAALDRARADRGRGAWISFVDREVVLARALELDVLRELQPERARKLPLFGVPFSVKDNIDAFGLETTAACPAFARSPSSSADCLALVLAAGGVLLGKNNMDQFATGLVGTRSPYGACRNAFDERYISGGSSSGSAVAVAAGHVSFSLGTDTAGSGRVPAGLNNVFGFKPSVGAVSTRGVVPASWSLDCVSIFARSADDAARVFDVIDSGEARAIPARSPKASAGPAAFRFGVPRQLGAELDDDARRLFDEAVRLLSDLGGRAVSLDWKDFARAGELVYSGPFVVERQAALGPFISEHPDACLDVIRQALAPAAGFDARAVIEGQREVLRLRQSTRRVWQRVDTIVVPTVPTEYTLEQVAADPLDKNDRLGLYTRFVNPLRLCAMAVPFAIKPNGIPFGVCLVGAWGSDRHQSSLARRVEQAVRLPAGLAAAASTLNPS